MAIFGKKNNPKENENKNNENKNNENETKETKTPETAPAAKEAAVDPSANAMPDATMTTVNPEKPRYHTPEGFDFNRYFLAERRIVLDNVSYETTKPTPGTSQFKLGVKDTIVAQVIGQAGVKATYNRMLKFDPDGPFVLSVSFAVMLVFNPGTRDEIDWHTIDVADEFKKNCPLLVQQMSAKAALIVAELTAANGGVPIIAMK